MGFFKSQTYQVTAVATTLTLQVRVKGFLKFVLNKTCPITWQLTVKSANLEKNRLGIFFNIFVNFTFVSVFTRLKILYHISLLMAIIAVCIDSYVMMSSHLYGTCRHCFYGTYRTKYSSNKI